jgi:hypothetical protein
MVSCYLLWQRLLTGAFALVDALATGVWLGLLRPCQLECLDTRYYDGQRMYHDETYNRRGLFRWEREAIEQYFGSARRLLVTSAGGGREVLGLLRLGYQVDAFECNANLAGCANRLLAAMGYATAVRAAERDRCPQLEGLYEGVVVGWAAFMLTPGSPRRIRLLRHLRALMAPGAPLLVSFFTRTPRQRRFWIIAASGNTLRRLQGREPLELGDDLSPNYVHHFDRPEIEHLLAAAGFELASFRTEEYGHAIGIAAPAAAEAGPPPGLQARPVAARECR